MVRDNTANGGDEAGLTPEVWGRRPYADKEAREMLNDVSRSIAKDRPDHVDDPEDPTLSEVLRAHYGTEEKATTLTALLGQGLTFQEAVFWYFYRHAGFRFTDIHYAVSGYRRGGDPAHERNSLRNIQRVLESAAFKVDSAEPDDVPDLADVLEADGE